MGADGKGLTKGEDFFVCFFVVCVGLLEVVFLRVFFVFLFVSVGWDGIGADGKGLVKDKAVCIAGGVFRKWSAFSFMFVAVRRSVR